MSALRWSTHALTLVIVALFCWASGDIAPLFGWALGVNVGVCEGWHRRNRLDAAA